MDLLGAIYTGPCTVKQTEHPQRTELNSCENYIPGTSNRVETITRGESSMPSLITSAIIRLMEHELATLEPQVQAFVLSQLQKVVADLGAHIENKLMGGVTNG